MKTERLYHYLESGLPNVWLKNGFTIQKTKYGEGVSIADVEGLHKVIADRLAKDKPKLTGCEFRFLRKELGLSQAGLAQLWGYDAQSIAMWEKRGRVPLIADRFIRVYYREIREGNAHIADTIDRLNEMDLREDDRLLLHETKKGWQALAA